MLTLDSLTTKQVNIASNRSMVAEYKVPQGKLLYVLPQLANLRIVGHETFTGTVDSDPVTLTGAFMESPNVSGVANVLCYTNSTGAAKALTSIDASANTITPAADWAAVVYDVFYLIETGYIDIKIAKENENGVSIMNERIEDLHIRDQYKGETAIRFNVPVPLPEYTKLQFFVNSASLVRWNNYEINSLANLTQPLNIVGIPSVLRNMPADNGDRAKLLKAFDAFVS